MQSVPLVAIQQFVGRCAVLGAFRGCPKGTSRVVRRYLGDVPLGSFATGEAGPFLLALDRETKGLQGEMPGHEWSFARKGMNIFLPDCLYNT